MDDASGYYQSVAHAYKQLVSFEDQYKVAELRSIAEICSTLHTRNTLVDIGAGTGTFLKDLTEYVDFRNLVAVEPNRDMLDKLKESTISLDVNLTKYSVTGEEFSKLDLRVDCITITSAIHHFAMDHLQEFFNNSYRQIEIGGKFILSVRPMDSPFPFWKDLKSAWTRQKQGFAPDDLIDGLKEAGFLVHSHLKSYPVVISRDDWTNMLRGRFISTLSSFSDQDIEDGIRQMDYGDLVEFNDSKVRIVADK